MKHALRLLLMFAVLAGGATVATAQKPPNVTPGEIALLPKYCPDTQGFDYGDAYYNTSPRAGYWVAQVGKGFWALHHHCWGLVKARRAMMPGTPPEIRKGRLEAAIADYVYVVEHTPPNFVLLPDVFMKIGDTYVLLDNLARAGEAYATARSLKPDFWPVYIQWAAVLDKVGRRKAALDHLEEGIRYNRSAGELLSLYRRLGGNADAFLATLPRPAATAASAPATAPASLTPSADSPAIQPALPGASAP